MSSARRRIKRTVPVAKKPVSASPVASRLHSKWRAGSVALLLLAVFALAWKFTPAPSASASTSSASAAPVALASLSDAPVETALLTPPLPLITPTNAPVPDAVKNALPASVPAQLGEPGAKLRRVVDKKIANGMVTLTLKDEQTGQLSTMTQPLGTNVSTVEAGGEEKVVASAPVVKPPDPVKDDFPTTGIEKVQAGMTVPTRNPITGKTEFKKVVRIFKHTVYEIVKLELTDGSPGKVVDSLRGTPQHPFFTPSGMVAMGELKPEMKVITRRGPPLVVKSVTREPHPQGIPVYNFEVEGDHTYFVGKAQGGTWVHNTCPPLGLLEGKSASVTQKGLDIIENHLSQLDHAPYNDAMLGRLRDAMANGQRISGADLSFYTHELSEATMMGRGMSYDAAHAAALSKYGVSPFSVYHPDVISAYPGYFNSNWRNAWGLR